MLDGLQRNFRPVDGLNATSVPLLGLCKHSG